MDNPNTAQ